MRENTRTAIALLREAQFSNREIARELGINESTVRRAKLHKRTAPAEQRFEITVRPL